MNERKRLRKLAGLNEEILLEIKKKDIGRLKEDLRRMLNKLDSLMGPMTDIAVKTNMVRAKESLNKALTMFIKAEKDAPR